MSPGDFDCGYSITSASYHGNLKSVFKLRQMARFYSENTPKPVLDGGCCSSPVSPFVNEAPQRGANKNLYQAKHGHNVDESSMTRPPTS